MQYVATEEERLSQVIRDLQRRVRDLENQNPHIPVLMADPPLNNPASLWLMNDGRLRGRLMDGTIFEVVGTLYTQTTPGNNPNSTALPPPLPYLPTEYVYLQTADWVQSYTGGGTAQRANDGNVYYGYQNATLGEQMSMLHFPGLDALRTPTNANYQTRIVEVWLHLLNFYTEQDGGTELRIGLHGDNTVTAAFEETFWTPYRVHVGKMGFSDNEDTDLWIRLPEEACLYFQDAKVQGVTLHQQSTDPAYFGYAEAAADLKIVYIK
jgi:hypothetical protein